MVRRGGQQPLVVGIREVEVSPVTRRSLSRQSGWASAPEPPVGPEAQPVPLTGPRNDALAAPRSTLRVATARKEEFLTFQVGERVVSESESTERRPRVGTVREVVRDQPPRYRIEWEDGHESIYTPAAGALRAERDPAGTAK